MSDQIQIQVRFSITQNGMTLNDALYYDLDTYNSMTPEQIQADEKARFDAWYAQVTTPPPQVEVTPDQQIADGVAQIASLADQQQQVADQINPLLPSDQQIELPPLPQVMQDLSSQGGV